MSSAPFNASNAGKKAVHVKWAGKTIALGTFPSAEADEKCARAKALTRAWRSTMRPKPSRDWVMVELESLGVRVVSGRLGRRAGEDDDEPDPGKKVDGPVVERNNSMGWGGDADLNSLMARRNSSLGLSMMGDVGRRGSLSSLGQVAGMEGDLGIPPHRPLVGGGAAAAYEAARHDHFTQKSAEQKRRASSLGLGNLTSGNLNGMGMSVNPNQHYEMLRLHHMNLLNEIQETTLMMNLYQQQQLQQQQQQLQQEAGMGGNDMSMMMQPNGNMGSGFDHMFGSGQLGQTQRASLGLGTMGGGNFTAQQQLQMMQQLNGGQGTGLGTGQIGDMGQVANQADMQSRVSQLKGDIVLNKGGEGFDASGEVKRQSDGMDGSPSNKRQKTDEGGKNNDEGEVDQV